MKNLATTFCSIALFTAAASSSHAQTDKGKGIAPPVAPSPARAPETTPAAALDPSVLKQIETFFTSLEKHQVDAAYDGLLKGTRIVERAEEVSTLKSKTQQAIALFGDLQGHEMVTAKSVGTRLLSVTYMSLGKDYPLRWRFYFYKGSDAWRLIDIRVDDRLPDMFEEPPTADERGSNWPARSSQPGTGQ